MTKVCLLMLDLIFCSVGSIGARSARVSWRTRAGQQCLPASGRGPTGVWPALQQNDSFSIGQTDRMGIRHKQDWRHRRQGVAPLYRPFWRPRYAALGFEADFLIE